MIKSLFKFFWGLIVLILIVLPLNYYIVVELLKSPFDIINYLTFLYFILLISIIQIMMLRLLKKRPQLFVPGFMGALGLKMFLTLIILAVLVYAGLVDKFVFGINFALLYFIFTTFSIVHILGAQRSPIDDKK